MILVLNSRSSANRHRRTLARGTVGLLAGRCPNPCWGSEQQQRDVVQRLPICMIEYVQETDLDVCTAYWSDRGHVVAEGGQCFASRGGAIARRIVVRVRLRGGGAQVRLPADQSRAASGGGEGGGPPVRVGAAAGLDPPERSVAGRSHRPGCEVLDENGRA